jgi:2-polyprenyl-3-methyl-5-hydroxy-6-metoxy-1,4-benzoquinol methylase
MPLRHTLDRIGYRTFRSVKRFYLEHPKAPFCHTFFSTLVWANSAISPRNLTPAEQAANLAWKTAYLARYGDHPPYHLDAAAHLASESDDHKFPRGSQVDNSKNPRFNRKVYEFFGNKPDFSLLDLGCSGGGLVRSVLADGFTAVGLEGSDISKRLGSAEWATIPYHLFTCDITSPFQIRRSNQEPMRFDVVTAWEVLEHIPEGAIAGLLGNIVNHLKPGGIFVGSIDMSPDGDPRMGAVYHVTLKPKDWWIEQFAKAGLRPCPKAIFETRDFVRGHGTGLIDWDPADGQGFHVVMEASD